MPRSFAKEVDATLDYSIDYSVWMREDDQIVESVWEVEEGLTKVDEDFSNARTTVWVSGGVANNQYRLVNTIRTLGGRVDQHILMVMVRQK